MSWKGRAGPGGRTRTRTSAQLKPWVWMLLVAGCIGIGVFGIHRYEHRFVRSDSDMVALLPRPGATIFFADIAAVRRAGLLTLFAGSKAAEEPEYRGFVRETHFDYARDIQAIAGSFDEKQILFIIRGRFDWGSLREYAARHGGACSGNLCSVPTSKPGRRLSFVTIQSDVMGLAVGLSLPPLAYGRGSERQSIPSDPVWVIVSRSLLEKPLSLPLPARILAISLQSADRVLLALESDPARPGSLVLRLEADCARAATAETIRTQLEMQTRTLGMELAREHQKPSPADLTGLLVAGTFRVAGTRVIGTWPVDKQLLQALE